MPRSPTMMNAATPYTMQDLQQSLAAGGANANATARTITESTAPMVQATTTMANIQQADREQKRQIAEQRAGRRQQLAMGIASLGLSGAFSALDIGMKMSALKQTSELNKNTAQAAQSASGGAGDTAGGAEGAGKAADAAKDSSGGGGMGGAVKEAAGAAKGLAGGFGGGGGGDGGGSRGGGQAPTSQPAAGSQGAKDMAALMGAIKDRVPSLLQTIFANGGEAEDSYEKFRRKFGVGGGY